MEPPRNERRIPEWRIALIAGLILLAACALFLFTLINGPEDQTVAVPSATPSVTPIADDDGTPRPVQCRFPDIKGSCALIESSYGETVLIDAGYEQDADTITALFETLGIKTLGTVFLTTDKEWAYGGMSKILSRFPAETLILSDVTAESPAVAPLLASLENTDTTLKRVRADFVSTFDVVTNAELRLLSPHEADYGSEKESALVLRLAYGESEVLFLSEAGPLAERMMLKALPNRLLHADMLFAVETGASEKHLGKFFDTVKPKLVLSRVLPDSAPGGLTEELEKRSHQAIGTGGTVHIVLDGVIVSVVE